MSQLDIIREFDDDVLTKWPPWFGWGIRGVEVTQAVQYYESARHLTDPADRQPDNSVTLIASKPAWVRVYVRSSWFSGDIPGVTGTITLRRRVLGFLWQTIATLTPTPPGATVTARRNPPYATERGTLGYTLNFVIPADLMCGNLRLDVNLTAPNGWTDQRQVYINATLRQTFRKTGFVWLRTPLRRSRISRRRPRGRSSSSRCRALRRTAPPAPSRGTCR